VLEIEVKVRIADAKAARTKLLEAGAVLFKDRYREVNTLYDDRAGTLRLKGCAFRLRTAGKKTFLTYKGRLQKSRSYKVREEYETEVKHPKRLAKILKALGFVPVYRYEKTRAIFKKKTLKICLDETAAGYFLEFEGERENIARFSKTLGISKKEWITLDYIQLLLSAGKGEEPPYPSSLSSPPSSAGSSSS
jgi:adenylate cyclase class 2